MNAPLKNAPTEELVHLLYSLLDRLNHEELESEMEDKQMGLISLYYAREALGQIDPQQYTPQAFLLRYQAILESRYHRLTDEDSGEYGSGRDALSYVITEVEKLLSKYRAPLKIFSE